MRLLIHDYAGHPFQVQLSRELARRNHEVLHLYAGYNVTPHGDLEKSVSDPDTFDISPIFISKPLRKYSLIRRLFQELEYGFELSKKINGYKPDIIISANTPLDAQRIAQAKSDARFVFWLQDTIGVATHRLMRKKIPVLGNFIGQYYIWLEKKLLKNSDHIVLISEDFLPLMKHWGINESRTTVVQNWAPLENISPQPRHNSWAQKHNLVNKFCFMYTGTLGMKHNPNLLFQLALRYRTMGDVCIVVISEGPGADWLREKKKTYNLSNLILMDYQPFHLLPEVMGAADVLVAILEKDAGEFSVPSKVLTYLCSKRPLLLAVSTKNLAARIVLENGAGIVVDPDDLDAFLDKSEELLNNPHICEKYANDGRIYAESKFDKIFTNIT